MADSKSSSISNIPHSLHTMHAPSSSYCTAQENEYENNIPTNQSMNNENNYPTLPTKETTHIEDTKSTARLHTEQSPAPPSIIMGSIKSLFSRIIRLILCIFIMLFNSGLLCYSTNYVLGKYLFVSQNIHFNLVDSNTLSSSIYFNCTRHTKNKYKHCNQLSTAQYTIILFIEFANRIHTSETDNIPIELKVYAKGDNVNKYEQLFYFEKLESIAETLNKILLSPLRFLGFFNYRKDRIVLVEFYDNYYEPIEKAEVIIKKPDLNIHYANILFKPMNGWISTLYTLFKFIIVIPMFFFFCIIQMGILVILRCTVRHLFRKKTKIGN